MDATEYRRLRKEVGTQDKVAGLLGVTRATINAREAGRTIINAEAALAIQALNAQQGAASDR